MSHGEAPLGVVYRTDAAADPRVKIVGLDQLWRKQWAARGVVLLDDQVGWGIPQAYKPRAAELGACLAGEVPLAGGVVSVAVFERGIIYYVKATGISTVELFAKRG